MQERGDKVEMSHHDFKQLMREYHEMAKDTGNDRLLAKCATLCMSQVVTSVTCGNNKKLCYHRDSDYISIARNCIK